MNLVDGEEMFLGRICVIIVLFSEWEGVEIGKKSGAIINLFLKIENIKFQKMLFIFNAINNGWVVKKENDLYIFKPNTEFTTKWYNKLLSIMDVKLNNLEKFPANTTREAADTMFTRYPIEWGEILLEIFHPLCFEHTDKLIKTMPLPITENYR
jgi:hypothetical protein